MVRKPSCGRHVGAAGAAGTPRTSPTSPTLPTSRRHRRGFLLPFVLVAMLLVATISGAAGLSAWRSMRAARLAWNGERAGHGADEALARVAADWDAETFAARPIGARWTRDASTADGASVPVAFVRTAPLVVVAEATSRSSVSGSPDTARRRISRVLALEAPRFPLEAALAVLGGVRVSGSLSSDGRDLLAATDGCGAQRDTASIAGVAGAGVAVDGSPALHGRIPVRSHEGTSDMLAELRATFDAAWTVAVDRTSRREAAAGTVTPRGAPPWSARYVTSADSVSRRVTFAGNAAHDGLLLVDGDLVIEGTLGIRGLLVVSGSLDVTMGRLDVEGGVLVRDVAAHGSRVADGVRIRYSPCAVLRAMAAVARPRFAPYGVWLAR